MNKKTLLSMAAAAAMLLSVPAVAEMMVVNIWKPMTGKAPQMYANGAEAASIQTKLGGSVTIGSDTQNRMHFAMSFENWADWAKHGQKMQNDKAWGEFLGKLAANPSAELEDQYFLNVASPGGAGAYYRVFIWEPKPGQTGAVVQSSMQAEKMHEKAGADVAILVDQLGRVHYVTSFDSWDAMAKFFDTPNPEFQAFMQEQNKNPNARMVKVYTAGAP